MGLDKDISQIAIVPPSSILAALEPSSDNAIPDTPGWWMALDGARSFPVSMSSQYTEPMGVPIAMRRLPGEIAVNLGIGFSSISISRVRTRCHVKVSHTIILGGLTESSRLPFFLNPRG